MTTATLRLSTPLVPTKTAPKKGPLVRFVEAMMAARMRQAMREIERHSHLMPQDAAKPAEIVPQDEVKRAGYRATFADAGMLPFVRGA
jgi:hypothetical protein